MWLSVHSKPGFYSAERSLLKSGWLFGLPNSSKLFYFQLIRALFKFLLKYRAMNWKKI